MIKEQLQTLTAQELREVIDEAKQLLRRKKLYIREITKSSAEGRYIYLYATWQEDGKTRQKSLGRKAAHVKMAESDTDGDKFGAYGIHDLDSVRFLESMMAQGYMLAN